MGGYVDDVNISSGFSGLDENRVRIKTQDFIVGDDGVNIPPVLAIGGLLLAAVFFVLRRRR